MGWVSLTEHDHWGIWWLPDLTNSYQVRACADGSDLVGLVAVTIAYHLLPRGRSESTPPACDLYQGPSPRGREAIIYTDYDVLAITGT